MAANYNTGTTTNVIVIYDDDGYTTIYYNNDQSKYSGVLPIVFTDEAIGEEPCKDEPDEPRERVYPLRHDDEILRIIMRYEVWKPPKQRMKAECGQALGFFSVQTEFRLT